MASSDATAIPVKNQAYRVTFPILDADGDLVAGATGLDSEVSTDGGTFTDCTNEATQIASSSGMYYLDLTASEMNADTVAIIVKSTEGKTVPIVLYPQEAGDINVDVTYWNGAAVATPTASGVPEVDVTHWIGTAAATPTTAGVPEVDVTYLNGSATAASSLSLSALSIKQGTVDTTAVATTTTSFESDDVTDSQADLYVGRLIGFTSGALNRLYCRITDYSVNGGRGAFTVTTLPTAPSNNDTFIIV